MDIILNMCGIEFLEAIPNYYDLVEKNSKHNLCGIRIGAETCSRQLHFIKNEQITKIIDQYITKDIPVYFVFPNIAECDFERAAEIAEICHVNNISGFVVNDFGMMLHIKEKYKEQVILGRTFDKRLRDIRLFPEYGFEKISESIIFSEEYSIY